MRVQFEDVHARMCIVLLAVLAGMNVKCALMVINRLHCTIEQ